MTIDLNDYIGKYMKTRDGSKVYVVGKTPYNGSWTNGSTHNFIAVTAEYLPYNYCVNGSFYGGEKSKHDIISEWEEPVKHKVKVYLDICMIGDGIKAFAYHNKTACIESNGVTTIAQKCIEIEFMEGEGLE